MPPSFHYDTFLVLKLNLFSLFLYNRRLHVIMHLWSLDLLNCTLSLNQCHGTLSKLELHHADVEILKMMLLPLDIWNAHNNELKSNYIKTLNPSMSRTTSQVCITHAQNLQKVNNLKCFNIIRYVTQRDQSNKD